MARSLTDLADLNVEAEEFLAAVWRRPGSTSVRRR
jgi:hypothetical protein